jgi:hypothetical protein
LKNIRAKRRDRKKQRSAERGVALVIAIFTMMLISVIATALILMAGTASAIKANYKSSMQAFYDAKAGLEEGRSRLWTGNASPLSSCVFPAPGSPMPVNRVCYIINPDPTTNESVDPTDLSAANPYADREYAQEFGMDVTSANVQAFVNSTSPIATPNIAGPLYKWVRITPVTQRSSGTGSETAPLLYDGIGIYDPNDPKDMGTSNPGEILAITALAVTPNGSRRLLQSSVAQPVFASMSFPSALTLDGNNVSFTAGGSAINGNDSTGPPPPTPGVAAIGYTDSGDQSSITTSINNCKCAGNYQGPSGNAPSLEFVNSLSPALQTPSSLDAVVQTITQNADLVITPPTGMVADQSSFPSGMSATNPLVIVVDGDFHLTHANGNSSVAGYGLLLVTGTFYYDPDDSWNGLILVIGKGVFDGTQNGHNGQINGAVLVAKTRDSSGNLLPDPNLGAASFKLTGGGNGIRYSSSWVKAAQARIPYRVLSFREIQQQTP